MVNKKGWIRIVEAFLAILLLMGILLVVISGDDVKFEREKTVGERQMFFLHEIQINNSFRDDILSLSELPVNSNESGFPEDLKSYFLDNFDNCFMNICLPLDSCIIDFETKGEVYSKEVLVSSNIDVYSPRKVKVFCYE